MPYVKGKVILPEFASQIQKNPLENIVLPPEEEWRKKQISISDADIKAFLPVSRELVTRGTTSDDGEFFLRVPSGLSYFLEVYLNEMLICLKFLSVKNGKEIDMGILDQHTSAHALYVKKNMAKRQKYSLDGNESVVQLVEYINLIEQQWRKGEGLEPVERKILGPESPDLSGGNDPSHLISSFQATFDEISEKIYFSWEANEPCRASLSYRPFHSRFFRQEHFALYRKKGHLVSPILREFEGYLYYLELQSKQGLLAQTPVYCLRAPIRKKIHHAGFLGRQEGPLVFSREKISGSKTIRLKKSPFEFVFQDALEKKFETEINVEFARKLDIPRFLVREGFHDIELNIYLPQDHSFLWGPLGDEDGARVKGQTWEDITGLWKKTRVEPPPNSIREIGYSTPFAEIVAFRNGAHFRLFTDVDLSDAVLVLGFRRIDTLGLESIHYYRGQMNLGGEGLFTGYRLLIDFEGRFEEDKNDDSLVQGAGEITGNIDLWTDLTFLPPKDVELGRG